jgi:hypothetical protein
MGNLTKPVSTRSPCMQLKRQSPLSAPCPVVIDDINRLETVDLLHPLAIT